MSLERAVCPKRVRLSANASVSLVVLILTVPLKFVIVTRASPCPSCVSLLLKCARHFRANMYLLRISMTLVRLRANTSLVSVSFSLIRVGVGRENPCP